MLVRHAEGTNGETGCARQTRGDLMAAEDLFELLDADGDGWLSRSDLRRAARSLHWHWREAPLYALLDHLTVRNALPRELFARCMADIAGDMYGPYGEVIRRSSLFGKPFPGRALPGNRACPGPEPDEEPERDADELVPLLEGLSGAEVAGRYGALLEGLPEPSLELCAGYAALLIIDPQRSFTRGSWMRSMGPGARDQVAPIQFAFENCGRMLRRHYDRVETMFSRCPFPPDSYDWDAALADVLDPDQLYFIKPGNSILDPGTNGFREWLADLARRGKRELVMGGCTLNSCVRVSAIETRRFAAPLGLAVVVDLSLSGARRDNYMPSPEFDGLSSVELTARQMAAGNVRVTGKVVWV
jgi:hypothetical protein